MEEKRFAISSGDKLLDVIHQRELDALIDLKHFQTLTITPFETFVVKNKDLVEEDAVPF